jgi:hypothetical protein
MRTTNKLSVGLMIAGGTIYAVAPDEKLSVEEKAAGVLTYKSIGSLMFVAGLGIFLYNTFISKSK